MLDRSLRKRSVERDLGKQRLLSPGIVDHEGDKRSVRGTLICFLGRPTADNEESELVFCAGAERAVVRNIPVR
jgi:hypothetical protein